MKNAPNIANTARIARAAKSRLIAIAILAAFSLFLLSSCGGEDVMADPRVESDPEILAKALVEASYEREYEFLWEHASVGLKEHYELDKRQFLLTTTSQMDGIVLEAAVDTSDTQIDYKEFASVYEYNLALEAPDESLQAFRIFIVQENEDTWAYCELQASSADQGYQSLIGDNDDSACF